VAVMKLLEKAIQLSVNRAPNIAYDQSRNVSEAEGAITGEILRSLAMLSDKILGRKGFSDNLKEAGTMAARPEYPYLLVVYSLALRFVFNSTLTQEVT
jgi:hypothetical protein